MLQRKPIHDFFEVEQQRKEQEKQIELRRAEGEKSVQQTFSQSKAQADSRKKSAEQAARDVLSDTRNRANAKLAAIRARAESKRQSEIQALNQQTQAAIEQGQKWLQEAEQLQQEALDQLEEKSAHLDRPISRSAQAMLPADIGTLNPTQMLEQSKNAARQAASLLDQELQNLIRWREKREFLRNAILAVSGVAILIALVMGIIFYDNHSKAQLYNSAKVLLEDGKWQQAQNQFQELLNKDSNYRDAQTLLYESYYRLSSAAIKAGNLEEARDELESLRRLNPSYRDTTALLCEVYYRLGAAAVKSGNWTEVRKALESLQRLNPSYRDATALLCEAYYRLGATALKDKKWAEARNALELLQGLNPSYRDGAALLRKTFYRLEDDFIDNRNRWDEKADDKVMLKIQNGRYIIQNKMSSNGWLAYHSIDMSQNEDFHIESKMKKVVGRDDRGYGLVWGLTDNNYYYFSISGNGQYVYGKQIKGSWKNIIGWVKSNQINNNSANKLTIKKSGNQIRFFINDNFVGQAQFEGFFGNRVGFQVGANMKVEIDNISVYSEVPRGWLGVRLQDDSAGVRLTEVLINGPAQKAGLLPQDSIVEFNNTPVRTSLELKKLVATSVPKTLVTLKIRRGKQILKREVVLGETSE